MMGWDAPSSAGNTVGLMKRLQRGNYHLDELYEVLRRHESKNQAYTIPTQCRVR